MIIIFGHIPKCGGLKIKNFMGGIPGFIGLDHTRGAACVPGDYRFVSIRYPLDWYVSLWAYKMTDKVKYQFDGNDFTTMILDIVATGNKTDKWFKPAANSASELFPYLKEDLGLLSLFFMRSVFRNWKQLAERTDTVEHILSNYDSLKNIDRVVRIENLREDMDKVFEDIGYHKKFNPDSKINATKHDRTETYYTKDTKTAVLKKEQLITRLCYEPRYAYIPA